MIILDVKEINELKKISQRLRKNMIEMVFSKKSGHLGGSFSCVDIILLLYKKIIKTQDGNRDSFILSKGHSAPALYCVLEEMNYIKEKDLLEFRKNGGMLKGHPNRFSTEKVEIGLGSLGMGLSVGVGEALGNKIDGIQDRVFVLLGDGELNEGEIWEAIMCAGHYQLNNLVGIIDRNKLQLDGKCEDIIKNTKLDEKFRCFGWNVEVINGHDYSQLYQVLMMKSDKPLMIIADTVKGKGVSYMENNPEWHSFRIDNCIGEYYKLALDELGEGCL